MQAYFRALLFILAALPLLTVPASAVGIELHALVVANENYTALPALGASGTDGHMVKAMLERFNYGVTYGRDVVSKEAATKAGTTNDFEALWNTFLTSLDNLPDKKKKALVVIYFSGHGAEIENDSYLIPVDTPANPTEAYIQGHAQSLRKLFADFRERQRKWKNDSGQTINAVFIIDACREKPKSGEAATKSTFDKPSSVPIAPPPGMFVLYAASAGQYAHTTLTGQRLPDQPSVFTERLLKQLEAPGSLQSIARDVRWVVHRDVAAKMPHQPQTPAYFDEMALDEPIGLDGEPVTTTAAEKFEPDLLKKKPKDYQEVWECQTCPHLVVVPPNDRFMMGSPRDEAGHEAAEEIENAGSGQNAETRMPVSLPRAFAIGITEVTVDEYRACMNGKSDDRCKPSGGGSLDTKNPDKPAAGMSWKDAQAYVTWLNRSLGLDDKPGSASGYYRLPTEVEWEYAARAGAQGRFVHGEELEKLCRYGNGADQSLHALTHTNDKCDDNKGRGVAQAKSYKPNGFGLYDVHGNVWEWTTDCWSDHLMPRLDKDRLNNGHIAFEGGDCSMRVVRGGSWLSGPEALRLAKRTKFASGHVRRTIGMRVVRVLPQE